MIDPDIIIENPHQEELELDEENDMALKPQQESDEIVFNADNYQTNMVHQQQSNSKPHLEIPAAALTKPNQRSNSQKSIQRSMSIAKKKNLSIDTEEINRESELRGEFLGEKALMNL